MASWSLVAYREPGDKAGLTSRAGVRFGDRRAEMGESFGADWRPYFFLKPPATTLVADGEPVLIKDPEDLVDWEGEPAVLIGTAGREIPSTEALNHVGGYTVVNDISLRRPHRRKDVPAPFVWDWLASEGADTSLPMASGIVPAWQIGDPQRLVMETRVNGILMQSAPTFLMVCTVAEPVAAASESVILEPGDLIAAGTPAGVGAGKGHLPGAGRRGGSVHRPRRAGTQSHPAAPAGTRPSLSIPRRSRHEACRDEGRPAAAGLRR